MAVAQGRVVTRQAVLGPARNAARAAAAGIAISVSARLLPGVPLWTLRVTGRRGRRRASVSRGRAWYARNRARQLWYSASRNQTARHRTLIQNLDRTLERQTARILQTEPDPTEIQRRLATVATRFAGAPRPRPLVGIRLDLQPDRGDLDANRTHMTWRYALGPNMTTGRVRVRVTPIYPLGRTRDLTHYLLRTAQPPIRDLGPYELSAHRITQQQRFVYAPDNATWGTVAYQARRWRACRDTIQFIPERREWNGAQRHFVRSGGNQALAERRARSMRGEVIALSRAATRRSIVQALLQYQDARRPRPLRSVNTEETFGGHTVERHVFGTGEGIQNIEDLARRAAFGEIVVRGRIRQHGGGRNPSAFARLRDANIALRAAAREIGVLWADLRDALASVNPAGGSFDWPIVTPPIHAVRARRAQGNMFPPAERPRYLRWRAPAGRPAGAGTRPLIAEHVAQPAPSRWSRWAARQPAAGPGAPQPAAPLTTISYHIVDRAQLVVRPTTRTGASGWFVLTLYPRIP